VLAQIQILQQAYITLKEPKRKAPALEGETTGPLSDKSAQASEALRACIL